MAPPSFQDATAKSVSDASRVECVCVWAVGMVSGCDPFCVSDLFDASLGS